MTGNMVQYAVLPNCTNRCDFCLSADKRTLPTEEILKRIDGIEKNIDYVDWKHTFFKGISLLGGEVYGYKDPRYEERMLQLLKKICDKILKVSSEARYSTVTNGIYKPDFLFKCIDLIVNECSISQVDVNFSYDLKYRYHTEEARKLALSNINAFHKRYNYKVGVQMILTQYVIDSVFSGAWDIQRFLDEEIPGNQLVFLYPHPIKSNESVKLPDFFFKRNDLLKFLMYLEKHFPDIHMNTILSTKHSCVFKYTGMYDPKKHSSQEPVLADGKEILQDTCGHSTLYQCYSDSDKCMLCDIKNLWSI